MLTNKEKRERILSHISFSRMLFWRSTRNRRQAFEDRYIYNKRNDIATKEMKKGKDMDDLLDRKRPPRTDTERKILKKVPFDFQNQKKTIIAKMEYKGKEFEILGEADNYNEKEKLITERKDTKNRSIENYATRQMIFYDMINYLNGRPFYKGLVILTMKDDIGENTGEVVKIEKEWNRGKIIKSIKKVQNFIDEVYEEYPDY